MAIIEGYLRRHGLTTEARLTAVAQVAREAAMGLTWEWRKRVSPRKQTLFYGVDALRFSLRRSQRDPNGGPK